MGKFISAGIGLLALAAAMQPATAADMPLKAPPPVPVWTWDGWYVGANVGYSWGQWGSTSLFNNNFPVIPGPPIVAPFNTAFTNSADPDVKGWVGGLHAGRNWQFQNLVVGLEGDFSWSDEKQSRDGSAVATFLIGGNATTLVDAELNSWRLLWFSTIRGRLGWANDGWLVYVSGGAAVGRAMYDHTSTVTATVTGAGGTATATVTNAFSESKTKWGYAVGVGIEKAFSPSWIGRLEYLYVDLGSYTFLQGTNVNGTQFDTSVRLHDNIVRAGISYLFNAGPVVAKY
jgi:outer membrane immunogenic protein